jgi:hypothetical protein
MVIRERSGLESCRIQSQEDQELGSPEAATTYIPQTSGVTQSVDLTNKGMGNHYLRDVHVFLSAVCARGPYLWHISPTRHLKVQNFEDTYEDVCAAQTHNEFERQPSLSGLLQDTVKVHFVRPLRRPLRMTLTITDETLALSIATEKCTVVCWQHSVTCRCPPSLPSMVGFCAFRIVFTFGGTQSSSF